MTALLRGKLPTLFLLAILVLLVLVAQGQEDDDSTSSSDGAEDAQDVDGVYEGGTGNEEDDSAVAAVYHNNLLYVAITTSDAIADVNAGGVDLLVQRFDSDLELKDDGVQLGGDGDDYVTAIAANEEALEIVIVGSTKSEETHLFNLPNSTETMDWFIATLNRNDLELKNSFVNGTSENDQQATAVGVIDGSFVVAGWTWGEYFAENAGAANDEDTVGYDLWVLRISSDLDDFEWKIQSGTAIYDEPSALLIDGDGDVYVVGTSSDDSGILSSDEEDEVQSMFVYCLDGGSGEINWEVTTELGFVSDESKAHSAVFNKDESEIYIGGTTKGVIPGFDGNSTDTTELFVVSLSTSDGSINWVWQSEAGAGADGTGGLVLADDGVSPIIGGIAFGNQFNLSSSYWEDGSGDMIAAMIDVESLEVSKYFVAAAASTLTRETPLALVKNPDEEDGIFFIGEENGEFEDADVEPGDTVNYLLLEVELEALPEAEEEADDGRSFPYWYIGVPVFVGGIVLFVLAYKWAAASQVAKAKHAAMV